MKVTLCFSSFKRISFNFFLLFYVLFIEMHAWIALTLLLHLALLVTVQRIVASHSVITILQGCFPLPGQKTQSGDLGGRPSHNSWRSSRCSGPTSGRVCSCCTSTPGSCRRDGHMQIYTAANTQHKVTSMCTHTDMSRTYTNRYKQTHTERHRSTSPHTNFTEQQHCLKKRHFAPSCMH